MASSHTTRLYDTSVHKSKYQPVNGFLAYVSCHPFCPQGHMTGELLLRSKPRWVQFNAHRTHQSHFNAHPTDQRQFNAHPAHQSQVGNSSACHCLRWRPHAAVSSMPLKTDRYSAKYIHILHIVYVVYICTWYIIPAKQSAKLQCWCNPQTQEEVVIQIQATTCCGVINAT